MVDMAELSRLVESGNAKKVKEMVTRALEENVPPEIILNEGLVSAMTVVGEKFKNNEIYVPEMLIAGRAMAAGMQVLEPILSDTGVKPIGVAVIGTVSGDLHDIGKNLVRLMLRGAGIEVHDLGVDVAPSAFVEKTQELGADMVCMSALLTTTMPAMKEVMQEFERRGVRDKYIFMIGGAPVTSSYAKEIRADFYGPDAATAAEIAAQALKSRGR